MEIIINIPEEMYNSIVNMVNSEACSLNELARAVVEGVVVPQGHGPLIDATDLLIKLKPFAETRDIHEIINLIVDAPVILYSELAIALAKHFEELKKRAEELEAKEEEEDE